MIRGAPAAWREELALLPHVVAYEWRKATAFRIGFVLNGLLHGLARPVVVGFVFLAMFESAAGERIRGYTFAELVRFLVWTAAIQKCLADWRTLDLAEQIFDGYVTKYLVLPVSYFTLFWGRFVQTTALQLATAALFWAVGAALVPDAWPFPRDATVVLQATLLVVLGAACHLLVYFVLNCLAFWLDVVWALLGMFSFVSAFVSGLLVPVALMPDWVARVFAALFPYWTVNGPAELLLGRLGPADFVRGLVVQLAWLAALQVLAVVTWRRGLGRYAGVGT